jgi:hypothetical protein
MEEPIVQNQAVDPQAREAGTVLFLVLAVSGSPYRLRALSATTDHSLSGITPGGATLGQPSAYLERPALRHHLRQHSMS